MTRSAGLPGVFIERSHRAFLTGCTGSGKTSLAKLLLLGQPHIAILDPKHRFTWGAAGVRAWKQEPVTTSDLSVVLRHNGPHPIIYRPLQAQMTMGCNAFFSWVFSRGDTFVYVDEVAMIANSHSISEGYAQCLMQGRELEVGVMSATQRPAKIPPVVMTESEHDFVFRLRNPRDRKTIGEWIDPQIAKKNPTGHGFWYFQDGGGEPRYYSRADLKPLG